MGPPVLAFVSKLSALEFGDDVGPEGSVVEGISGGGSIMEECVGEGTAGSGNAARLSSAEEVSIVMCFVGGCDFLSMKYTGEHLTTTDGFLCPGR